MARRAGLPPIALADSVCDPPLAGLGLFRRVLCRGESARSPRWRTWPFARDTFSPARPDPVPLDLGWVPPTAHALLDWLLGSFDGDSFLGGNRVVAPRAARLRQCYPHGRALGALHVVRAHWPGLVFLRVGNSTSGNGLSGYFPLPAPGRPAVSAAPTAQRCHLVVSLADLPNHAWRGADQAARRSLLAGPDLPVLPLRNPAASQSAKLVAPFSAALVSSVRRALEPFHRASRALVHFLAAACAARRGRAVA